MTYFIAIATEHTVGQILASTKLPKYKGLTKQEFEKELKESPSFCWSFEVKEVVECPLPECKLFN